MAVIYSDHAWDQMIERGVSEAEVIDTLTTGTVTSGQRGRQVTVKVHTAGYGHWGNVYRHKEVQAVHVQVTGETIIVTVKARYGFWEGVS